MTRDDVYLADEAFFCGTAVELTPIVELDRRAIGDGRAGPDHARAGERARGGGRRAATRGTRDWLTPIA